MVKVVFDFDYIFDFFVFYCVFFEKFVLSESFGVNLDVLWDVVIGEIVLLVEIEFIYFNYCWKCCFGVIVLLFEEVEEELVGSLCFNIV